MTPDPNAFPPSIFTNTSAFGLMDHADELRRWYQMGGEVEYYNSLNKWVRPRTSGDLFPSITYRAVRPALIPPSVDWSHLLDWVQWVAWDRSGEPWGFEYPPEQRKASWVMADCDERAVRLTATPGLVRGTVPWTEAIVQRPDGV